MEEVKVVKTAEELKSAFVKEKSADVSQLKSMFEGPAARQKAFEKSMIKVESQLQKGQEHAKE